jgi:hypothetical protein
MIKRPGSFQSNSEFLRPGADFGVGVGLLRKAVILRIQPLLVQKRRSIIQLNWSIICARTHIEKFPFLGENAFSRNGSKIEAFKDLVEENERAIGMKRPNKITITASSHQKRISSPTPVAPENAMTKHLPHDQKQPFQADVSAHSRSLLPLNPKHFVLTASKFPRQLRSDSRPSSRIMKLLWIPLCMG